MESELRAIGPHVWSYIYLQSLHETGATEHSCLDSNPGVSDAHREGDTKVNKAGMPQRGYQAYSGVYRKRNRWVL